MKERRDVFINGDAHSWYVGSVLGHYRYVRYVDRRPLGRYFVAEFHAETPYASVVDWVNKQKHLHLIGESNM